MERLSGKEQRILRTLSTDREACVTYLFRKKWPEGFRCNFCNRINPQTQPSEAIVCRYCGRQTSIASRTLMHGSKIPLVGWMLAAKEFCFNKNGISAGRLRKLLEVSSYQTAWSLLHKLRRAASIAEQTPLQKSVICDIFFFYHEEGGWPPGEQKVLAGVEYPSAVNLCDKERIKFVVQCGPWPLEPLEGGEAICNEATTLFLGRKLSGDKQTFLSASARGKPVPATFKQQKKIDDIITLAQFWMNNTYRGAVSPKYLQSYLDEFCFRYNGARQPDRLKDYKRLILGLVKPAAGFTAGSMQAGGG